MTTGVPGVVETIESYGETTLVVDAARIVEACTHLRDEEGYNVLVDLSGVDGWFGPKLTVRMSSRSCSVGSISRIVGHGDGIRVPS